MPPLGPRVSLMDSPVPSRLSRRMSLSGHLLSTVVTRGNGTYNDSETRASSSHRQLSAVPRLQSSRTSESTPLLPRRSTSLQHSATTRHQLPHTKPRDGRGAVRRRLAPDSVIHKEILSAPTKKDQKKLWGNVPRASINWDVVWALPPPA